MTASLVNNLSREIAYTRVYDAPKHLLIRMWSNPDHITNWWGPRGFSTTTHSMDFKTDGIWRFTMHGPDGKDYPNLIRYTYVSPDRIEYEQNWGKDVDFTVRVDFREVADSTEMSFRMTFPSVETCQLVKEEIGADKGLQQTTERLEEYVVDQDSNTIELVIVRQFDAPQERVWAALTEPEQLRQWLGPIGLDLELNSGDARVGGHWSLVMSNSSGMHEEADGEYLVIDPIHLLKMTHRWKKGDGTYKPTTTITYQLHSHQGMTTMTFVQSGFWSEDARWAHLCGWDSCLHQLTVLLGSAKADRLLHLSREFDAPIDLVWNCWTEPQRMASWFAPKPFTCPRCEIDLRPGGSIYLVMRAPDGYEHAMSAIIVDIEPNSRLGWVFTAPDVNGQKAIQGGTMVMFQDLGGRTKVTVYSYASAVTEPGTYMIGGMEIGWNMTLDQMVEAAISTTTTEKSK